MKTLRIISRKSLLAQVQAQIVADKIKGEFEDIQIEFVTKETSGDISHNKDNNNQSTDTSTINTKKINEKKVKLNDHVWLLNEDD